MNDIKRGISLYTFQEALYFHKLNLEDTIAAAADMGAKGIEIIPDQSIREFPNISDDFVDKWHGMMARYGTTPTCMNDFVETRLYKQRAISEDEQLERFINAVKVAKKLGCYVIREQFALGEELMTPHLLERCLPYAEKYNVFIGMEVHAPNYLGNPEIEEFMEIMQKNPYATIVADWSMFMTQIPKVINDFYARQGARKEVLDYANEAYKNRIAAKEVIRDSKKFNLSPIEEAFFANQFRFNCYIEPETMKDYARFIKHFHGKTFGVSEDLVDDCIDVPRVLKVIQDMGYKGYISTENEGNRYVHDTFDYDCVEQAWRHQQLMKNILGY
jgi:sugar phosphate isomerase/epimerase